MNRKSIATAVVAAAIVATGASAAYAGTNYGSYNTTVGAFNGSGYTGYQTQSTTGASGSLHSWSVGGNYEVDARIEGPIDGDWDRNIGDSENRLLNNDNTSGKSVRVQFSNDLSTSVSVQVTGEWRSN